jgi:OHS family lactose permease-like MFS transporter
MEFGQIRMWGSLGWAVASSFSGLLFNLSPAYNFIMGSVASVIMLVVLSLKVNTNSVHAGEVLTKEKLPRRMSTPCCVTVNSGPSACMWQVWRG